MVTLLTYFSGKITDSGPNKVVQCFYMFKPLIYILSTAVRKLLMSSPPLTSVTEDANFFNDDGYPMSYDILRLIMTIVMS